MVRWVTIAEVLAWVRAYEEGATTAEIAATGGRSKSCVHGYLKGRVTPRPTGPRPGHARSGLGNAIHTEPVVCGRRICSGCRRWRPISDFGFNRSRGRLNPTCRACDRGYRRKLLVERDERHWREHREYGRIWAEARRRRQGVVERALSRQPPPDPRGAQHGDDYALRRVPTASLVGHVDAWLRAYAAEHPAAVNGRRGVMALARRASVPERRINGVLRLETATTHYVVADRLAVAMGLTLTLIYPDL